MNRLTAGKNVALSARALNASAEAARKFRQRQRTFGAPPELGLPRGDVVFMLNDTGSDLGPYAVVAIDEAPLISADLSPGRFLAQPAIKGVMPDLEHLGRFAVILSNVPNGRIGRAIVGGVTAARIKMIDDSHHCADLEEATTAYLVSGSSGAAQILCVQPAEERTGGVGWALIRFGSSAESVVMGIIICCGPRGPELDPAPDDETYWVAERETTNSDGDPVAPMTVAPQETPKPTVLTTRSSDTEGTLTATTEDHGLEAGDTLDLEWAGGARSGVVVGTISGAEIPISGGTGDSLPDEDTAITYLCTVEGKEYCNWTIRIMTCDEEVPMHTHLVPIGTPVTAQSRADQSDPPIARWFFSTFPWFLYLVFAGVASAMGTRPSAGCATYYVDQWSPMYSSPPDEHVNVLDSCIFQGYLHAVGHFDGLGGVPGNDWKVAKWDHIAGRWVGIDQTIFAYGASPNRCLVHDFGTGEVLVVGGFRTSDGNRPVATWDGESWTVLPAVGTSTDWTVYDLIVWNDDLYIAGVANAAADIKGIAQYSGSSWAAVGNGTGLGTTGTGGADPTPEGRCFAIHDDGTGEALYIGGRFIRADALVLRNVAKWNGSIWKDLGGGIAVAEGAGLRALCSDEGKLWAGGVGLSSGARLLAWDGNAWSPVGDSLSVYFASYPDPWINAIVRYGGGLLVGGYFQVRGRALGLKPSGAAVGYLDNDPGPDEWENLE